LIQQSHLGCILNRVFEDMPTEYSEILHLGLLRKILCILSKEIKNIELFRRNVSQPPGRDPVPGPGINYTGPREFVILVF
jgi:hypothetical protein